MELISLESKKLIKKSENVYCTDVYTSHAGNRYHSSIVLASGLVLKEDIGRGYCHTFLNKLEIYSFKDKVLIADKRYHSFIYTRVEVIQEIIRLLMKVFTKAIKKRGLTFNKKELQSQLKTIAVTLYEAKRKEIK